MTKQDLWNAIIGNDLPENGLADDLNRSNYDEHLVIDLQSRQYRYLYHTEDKFVGNLSSGDFDRLYSFATDHFVHPEDAEAYRAMVDPDTMLRRLAEAPVPGILRGDFRLKGTDNTWIWTRHILIAGPELGDPEEIVHCYVYDTHRQRLREEGIRPAPVHQIKREESTGLLDGIDYFRDVQARMDLMTSGWCLIYIQIDQHKLFTDWFGLDSGQYLLTQVSEILQRAADKAGGLPGYLGEENFCLTIPYDKDRIDALYNELQDLISSVSTIEGFRPIFGIAMIDGSCTDIREYFNHAALTAEEIRDDMHTRVRIYDAEVHKRNSREYKLLFAFQQAIERGEITFWLQPQCRLPDHKVVGAEALARWITADGEMIPPDLFVPILEKHGLVSKLDQFIWESVCKWLRSWLDRGKQAVPISINVSRIDIFSLDVPKCFSALIEKYGLAAKDLKIEITETAYAQDSGVIRETVRQLRSLGFMVLMDDFGSGYSSLNMLRSVSMDVIKLDAQFLHMQNEDLRKGVSILESVVNMTRSLATPVIVEGVETGEQVRYLADLGCRFMQGFFFYHPMPVAQFEALIGDESHIDNHGYTFMANEQLHVREFMDENIYSDVMLNNLLGAVAFYSWKDENIDIIRYNTQFYRLVGIAEEDFSGRQNHIQDYFHPDDLPKMYDMFRYADLHRVNGAKGVVRVYRPNGVLVWLSIQMYYINEDEKGKVFYASLRDVSEEQLISSEMPGGYYRCMMEDHDFEFLFISQNFLEMTGYSKAEISRLFGNKLINMVHPNDAERLREDSRRVLSHESSEFRPYRLRRKQGDYIYVADQSHLTDHFGAPCWQSVIVDVTEVMHVRSQMRILSRHLTDEVLFLRRKDELLEYEVAIHGLADQLHMTPCEFEDCLNSGQFCQYVEGHQDIPHQEYTRQFISEIVDHQKLMKIHLPQVGDLSVIARADRVQEPKSSIEYIVILRLTDRTGEETDHTY